MLGTSRCKIKIIGEIDVTDIFWCNSAVLISVKNGKGALTHRRGPEDDKDYSFNSQLLLNGKPIIQSRYPVCGTCTGMLAAGCGTENIDCAELEELRRNINAGFVDISTSAEIMEPVLGLLDDGYYLLADVPHYPVNGSGEFFHCITEEPEYWDGTEDYYISSEAPFIGSDSFPAYLYPTQSAKLYDRKRIDYYIERFKSSKKPPRAVAYYETGFFSALLDGHHKTYAAAILGKMINCLTIIPVSGVYYEYPNKTGIPEAVSFGGKKLSVKDYPCLKYAGYCPKHMEDFVIEKFPVSDNELSAAISAVKGVYPTVEELAAMRYFQLKEDDFTDSMIDEQFDYPSEESTLKLMLALNHFLKTDPPKARELALRVVKYYSEDRAVYSAYQTLTHFRDKEVEQLFINYLVENDKQSKYYKIADSYWDNYEE